MTKFKKGAKKHKKLNKSGVSKEMIEFMSGRPLVIKGKMLDPRKNYEDVLKVIEDLKLDSFIPKELKEIPTERILDAMNTPLNAPFLPQGNNEK